MCQICMYVCKCVRVCTPERKKKRGGGRQSRKRNVNIFPNYILYFFLLGLYRFLYFLTTGELVVSSCSV